MLTSNYKFLWVQRNDVFNEHGESNSCLKIQKNSNEVTLKLEGNCTSLIWQSLYRKHDFIFFKRYTQIKVRKQQKRKHPLN